ncbi:hypothetical protein HPB51_020635 [Rhipicephalus microplus]|uniref:Uncharacterized protein n=1 Tax=Rhipicephalus microplus TaxID=6941 RepID=A0A9J6DJF5_RHIMP|nr:hypothetical protein HPB51_020635 [Rhipicephalus microplus]
MSIVLARVMASTIDGRRKGACLFCQEYFMDLYLLAELKTISLKVHAQLTKAKAGLKCAAAQSSLANFVACY